LPLGHIKMSFQDDKTYGLVIAAPNVF
jgi:hypothetical protein